MTRSVQLIAVGLIAASLVSGCKEEPKLASEQQISGISTFMDFLKASPIKDVRTHPKRRVQIPSVDGIGINYKDARVEAEVYRFADVKTAKDTLPGLKAVRRTMGESENCDQRGYFIGCGEEKFMTEFRKF